MDSKIKKRLQFLLLLLGSGALGFFIVMGALEILPDQVEYLKGGGVEGVFAIVLLLFLSYFTVVSLHELGHLLTGLTQGFRFYLYVVGFLGIKRDENEQVKVYFNKDMQLFGGIAGSFPTKDEPNNLRKLAWVVAAGPLTTLFTGILFTWGAFAMLYHLTPYATTLHKLFTGFLLISSFLSVAIFCATTIPNRTGPFFTDRARFFRLIRGGKTAQIEQAVLNLTTLTYTGKRYRDLNKMQMDLIQTDPTPIMQYIGIYYTYFYHLDRQEYQLAHRDAMQLEQASAGMPAALKNEFLREAAFSYAFIAQDAAKAEQCWQVVRKFYDKLELVQVLRTKIAMLLVQKEPEQASSLLQKAFAKLSAHPQKGTDLLEQDLLLQLQAQLTKDAVVTS